ncbi:MAG: Fe-S-binding domain-containing protein, partial [Candidatus Binataceae bacterium]
VMLASIGLPGLNGFVGEFLILFGSFLSLKLAAGFAVVGLILGALYMMWAYERVMWGPITKVVNETIADLGAREIAVLVPLMGLMLLLGLHPQPLLSRMEPSVAELLGRVHAAEARAHRPAPRALALLPFVAERVAQRPPAPDGTVAQ